MGKLLSTTQAGEELGVSRQRVTQLINDNSLKAVRIGTFWAIDKDDLEEYKATRRSSGRPRTKTQ